MGYQARRTYRLRFEDELYEGLEVDTRSPAVGEYFNLVELAGSTQAEDLERQMQIVADHLVSWNMEDEGNPLPATIEGLRAADLDIVFSIIAAWAKVVGGADGPLGRILSSGEISRELSTDGPGGLSENQLSSLAASSSREPA